MGGRVTGYLVVPPGTGPFPAILFLHWGMGSRASFLGEALAYARAGAVSLLLDAPGLGSRRDEGAPRLSKQLPAQRFVRQCVSDLRRGVDFLCLRHEVDARRLAYVGHSLGASVGGQFAGTEPRVRAHVLMGGFGELSRGWSPIPDARFTEAMRPWDAVRHIHRSPAAFLFQYGTRDELILREDAQRYFEAAPEPRRLAWYEEDHRLGAEALRDRAAWLQEQLGLPASPPADALAEVRLPRADVARYFALRPLAATAALLRSLRSGRRAA